MDLAQRVELFGQLGQGRLACQIEGKRGVSENRGYAIEPLRRFVNHPGVPRQKFPDV